MKPTDPTLPFASGGAQNRLEPEYSSAFTAWQQKPTPQTRSDLLRQLDPVIQTGIKSFGGPSRGSPTLRSNARRLALQSFDTYDPAKGALKTHVLSNLRRLQRLGGQEAQIISLPEQVSMQKRQLDLAENELRYSLGRDPSDLELADHVGLSVKRIGYIRQAQPVAATSQIEDASEDGSMPASTVPGNDAQTAAWENLVYHDLSPQDQALFDMLLGRNGRQRMTASQAAAKLGVTVGAVSQRAAKIQAKLDERFNQSVL